MAAIQLSSVVEENGRHWSSWRFEIQLNSKKIDACHPPPPPCPASTLPAPTSTSEIFTLTGAALPRLFFYMASATVSHHLFQRPTYSFFFPLPLWLIVLFFLSFVTLLQPISPVVSITDLGFVTQFFNFETAFQKMIYRLTPFSGGDFPPASQFMDRFLFCLVFEFNIYSENSCYGISEVFVSKRNFEMSICRSETLVIRDIWA